MREKERNLYLLVESPHAYSYWGWSGGLQEPGIHAGSLMWAEGSPLLPLRSTGCTPAGNWMVKLRFKLGTLIWDADYAPKAYGLLCKFFIT